MVFKVATGERFWTPCGVVVDAGSPRGLARSVEVNGEVIVSVLKSMVKSRAGVHLARGAMIWGAGGCSFSFACGPGVDFFDQSAFFGI